MLRILVTLFLAWIYYVCGACKDCQTISMHVEGEKRTLGIFLYCSLSYCHKTRVFNWTGSLPFQVCWLAHQDREIIYLFLLPMFGLQAHAPQLGFVCVCVRERVHRSEVMSICLQSKNSYPLSHLFNKNRHFPSDIFL